MEKFKKINYHKIIWYFTIFSIIGLIIETIYCYITTGKIESRKGLIIGPFCPIYGLGAATIIAFLDNSNKNKKQLFLRGFFFGSIIEYIISYILEAIYGMRFWEYSYLKYNLNGRISLIYSIFWGILTAILIKYLSPKIDKVLNKIKNKKIAIILFIFFIINSICTVWAINTYKNRVINNNQKIEIKNIKQYIEEKIFSNEIMSKTFPNLRMKNEKGEEVFIREYL